MYSLGKVLWKRNSQLKDYESSLLQIWSGSVTKDADEFKFTPLPSLHSHPYSSLN